MTHINTPKITDDLVYTKEDFRRILLENELLLSENKILRNKVLSVQSFFNESFSTVQREDATTIKMRNLLNQTVQSINWGKQTVRILNAMMTLDIYTISDLITNGKWELLKCRNFGRKCMIDIEKYLLQNNLNWEINVSKYK